MDRDAVRNDVGADAATWYARLHADDATPAERLAFDRWLAADAGHSRAWSKLTVAARTLDTGRDDPALLAMIAAARGDAPASTGARPVRRWWPMAAAAAAVLAIGGTTAIVLNDHAVPAPAQIADVRYTTSIGEARDITLADGTIMTLDAASAVSVSAPGATRRVAIERGQAFFRVAHDKAHPFVASAAGNSVTALGTEFAVRKGADRVIVSLIEGSVRVDTPAIRRSTMLTPGNILTIQHGGLQLATSGAATATGWRNGELTFDSAPLRDVVADLNRYSVQQIELSDPKLANRVFSGVLKTNGGGTALADALGAYGIARIARSDAHHLVLAPL